MWIQWICICDFYTCISDRNDKPTAKLRCISFYELSIAAIIVLQFSSNNSSIFNSKKYVQIFGCNTVILWGLDWKLKKQKIYGATPSFYVKLHIFVFYDTLLISRPHSIWKFSNIPKWTQIEFKTFSKWELGFEEDLQRHLACFYLSWV